VNDKVIKPRELYAFEKHHATEVVSVRDGEHIVAAKVNTGTLFPITIQFMFFDFL
jgi:hypothetical protein